MFKNAGLQEYLSLGYIFLVVLGIVSESIFYGLLEVPYLQYTSILDVLISPISLLADNWKLLVFFVFACILLLFLLKKSPQFHENNKHKKWYQKLYNVEKLDKKYSEQKNNKSGVLFLVFLMIFSMLVGFRIGIGGKYRSLLKTGDFKMNYTLVFKDNTEIKVKKIGQNSLYIFYLQEGEKVVTATPISDNIKQIKRIPKAD